MNFSDYIAFAALVVSLFTFYWTSLRAKDALYLVRINTYTSKMTPEFAIINAGTSDVLVTSVLCAFEMSDSAGWESPDDQQFVKGDQSFSISAGKSHHIKVEFPSKFNDLFLKDSTRKNHGSLELFHRNLVVIVEWIDSKGKEHSSESKIIDYGFNNNGEITMSSPLKNWHDLYKCQS